MWTLIQVCFVLANIFIIIENMRGAQRHFFSDAFGLLMTKILCFLSAFLLFLYNLFNFWKRFYFFSLSSLRVCKLTFLTIINKKVI